jgi:threonine dehydrogenase-like Zn-dependent dehydrogenase
VRQLVHTKTGRVEWQDAPDPQLTDEHAAIVEPLAVARCDLDAPMVERGLFPAPYPVGHGHVRLVDTDPDRVRAAAALGVDATHHQGAWPKRFGEAPITVDATGHADGLATVLRSTARYGHCNVAFGFEPATPVPLLEMYTRGITVHTSRADSLRYLPHVLRLVAATAFDPLAIPATVRSFDQAADVWLEPAIKLIIER